MPYPLVSSPFFFSAFLLLWPASTARTQDIDSALRYFPLAVGNIWQYEREEGITPPLPGTEPVRRSYFTVEVLRDTLMNDGKPYFELSGTSSFSLIEHYLRRYVRIDSASGNMYEFGSAEPFTSLRCESAQPQFSEAIGCGEKRERFPVFELSLPVRLQPNFETSAAWAYGFGYVAGGWSMLIDAISSQFIHERLIYAKIDGREYGRRLDAQKGRTTTSVLRLQAAPNPCGLHTMLALQLPSAGYVRLTLNDAAGMPVRTLADEPMDAGGHGITLNTEGLANGTYFCVLQTGDRRIVQPIVVFR